MLQQNALEKLAARDRWEGIQNSAPFLENRVNWPRSESKLAWFFYYHLPRFKESGVASFKLRCAKGVKCKVNDSCINFVEGPVDGLKGFKFWLLVIVIYLSGEKGGHRAFKIGVRFVSTGASKTCKKISDGKYLFHRLPALLLSLQNSWRSSLGVGWSEQTSPLLVKESRTIQPWWQSRLNHS